MAEKIIAVVGATGAQGGGLVKAIQEDPQGGFRVRAITRHPDSDKGKALAAAGHQVVAADLDDVESLKRAFDGAHGVFCVTNFWEHFSPEKEIAQGKNMAEAARAGGVEHAVWSTFEDTRKWVPLDDDRMPTLQGKYKVPHFDGKAEADEFFRKNEVPTTFLLTSFYWDNFIHFGMGPQKGPDGKYAITLPTGDKKMPSMAAGDIGGCVYGILKDPSYIGKTVGIAGDHVSGAEMAAGMSKALGVEIGYNSISPDAYRGLGFPGADDLGNMFQFKRDFNDYYTKVRSLEESRRLNPELQNFATWVDRNKERIPLS